VWIKDCHAHEEEKDTFLAFWRRSEMAVTWLFATFLICINYVHSVEDSMLMSIFDQSRFSFVL